MQEKRTAAQRLQAMLEAAQLREQDWTQQQIAEKFHVSQPTVHLWLKKLDKGTLQQQTAAKIREELVDCNIYQRFMSLEDAVAQQQLKVSGDWHDICFYGEWAARIAEEMKE